MSLIDLASMVLAPTAVKDGKVYNAIPNDQDFNFSRGTEATRVNSAGLIEKARTNLLLQSNTFDTTWTTGGLSETSGQTGYDGSSDAWLVENVAGGSRFMTQTGLGLGVATCSIYAKAGTTDWIYFNNGAGVSAYYDLTNGVLGTTSGVIDANIESIGSGWYRCSMTASSINEVRYYLADSNNSLPTSIGDNVYFQDAQAEQGLVSTSYIPTTTSSVTVGITDDLPRVDYSGGGCPSLLLEPSRTNEVQYSEYFEASNWSTYSYGGASLATDFGYESPEGKNNAYKFSYTAGSGGNGILFTDNFTATASVDYTLSVWMKGAVGGEKVRLCLMDTGSNGVIGSTFTLTNEWALYTDTITNSAGTNRGFQFRIQDVIGVNDDQVVYVYGAQAEAGSYSTSYLPTYGTSTSRSADSCSLTNASNLIGQSEGTFFWEGSFQNSINPILLQLIPSSGNYTNSIYLEYTGGNIRISSWYSGTLQAQISVSASLNTNYKIAFAYKENDFVAYVNGTSIGSDTSGSIPDGLSRVFIGQLNSTTAESFVGCKPKQTILFPTRLTNDQLAELTK